MEFIISIDIGTSSTRAVIYDICGKSHFTSSYEYNSIYIPPGLVEQDPKKWYEAVVFTMKNAAKYADEKKIKIIAIAVTSQRASVIPLDKEGNHLYNAITWQDKRSIKICRKLTEKISLEEIYKKTGLRANAYFSLPKILWFKEESSEIYKKAYKLIGVQDYIIYQLTGNFKTDWTQGARTMLMDIKSFKWDEEMIDIAGINPDLLCELCAPGTNAGGLKKDFADIVELQAGIPVIISGGDQQNAALALDIIKPGYAEVNTGTGSFIIAFSNRPVFDDQCRVLCSASAIPGKWIIEAGIFNTGSIYRWFKNQFYNSDSGDGTAYKILDDEAGNSPVGSNGVILIPHFEGSAAPYWNPLAKGLFFNLSLGTKRGDMARAILEGISMEIADDISLIESLSEDEISTISIAGGMTKSDLFNQIQADMYNKNIIRYPNSEASSLGAAMLTAVSVGIYNTFEEAFNKMIDEYPNIINPNIKNVSRYEKLRIRKHNLYNVLNRCGIYDDFMEI